MYSLQKVLRNYKSLAAVILFLCLFSMFHYTKPAISYEEDGSFRPFGVGYRHKTILPVWLVAIHLGILSYTIVIMLTFML